MCFGVFVFRAKEDDGRMWSLQRIYVNFDVFRFSDFSVFFRSPSSSFTGYPFLMQLKCNEKSYAATSIEVFGCTQYHQFHCVGADKTLFFAHYFYLIYIFPFAFSCRFYLTSFERPSRLILMSVRIAFTCQANVVLYFIFFIYICSLLFAFSVVYPVQRIRLFVIAARHMWRDKRLSRVQFYCTCIHVHSTRFGSISNSIYCALLISITNNL